jgi:hypothetical protein
MVHRSVSIIFEPIGRVLAIMQRFYRFVTSASTAGELGARHRSQICRGPEQRFARLPFHATAKTRMSRPPCIYALYRVYAYAIWRHDTHRP